MISHLTQTEWDKKAIELSGSILQSWAWGEFQNAYGQKIYRFVSEEAMGLMTELVLPFGKKYWYSSKGPLGRVEDILVDIKEVSNKEPDVIFARLEPQTALDLPASVKETQPNNNWMLNIEPDEQRLLIDMKAKTRYNINLAARKGVKVREGKKEDLLIFWKLALETSQKNDFKLNPQQYYWLMWETLSPKFIKLLIAEYNGTPLAAILVTLFGEIATYLHGGSTSAYKDTMAPYLLHWEAIKFAKQQGYKVYDFGGVAPSNSEGHGWAGISRFKKSFGGFEVSSPGSFDLVLSPIWYNVYKNARTLRNIIKRS